MLSAEIFTRMQNVNDKSTHLGHFVSSPRDREKWERKASKRGKEKWMSLRNFSWCRWNFSLCEIMKALTEGTDAESISLSSHFRNNIKCILCFLWVFLPLTFYFLCFLLLLFTPFTLSGLFYHNSLDHSIFNRRGVWLVFIYHYYVLIEFPVINATSAPI